MIVQSPQSNPRHLANYYETLSHSDLNASPKVVDREPVFDVATKRKKVCIYGNGLFKAEAPLGETDWEVWALNLIPPLDTFGRLRADRWFDLHQRCAQSPDDMIWIGRCPFPIYLPPDLVDASPNGLNYPLEAIEDFFSVSYFTSTFAYQVALALYEGCEHVGVYGAELAYGTQRERTVEYACLMYWIGRAVERGVVVEVPKESLLGRHPGRYGFEYRRELESIKRYTDYLDQGDEARRRHKDGGGVDIGG